MLIRTQESGIALNDIAYVTNGKLLLKNSRTVYSISTDSRKIEKDSLFIALKGENFDGHDYIPKAFEAGAACVLSEKIPDTATGNVILVENTLTALGALAKEYQRNLHPHTVAVTGSVGKTTTKQFIYAVLQEKFRTHKTDGNLNNEIGLPLTLLQMDSSKEAVVLEMGMSFAGEIGRLSRIAEPELAVITNIGNCHIENLGSRENICKAKLEIIEGMSPNGTLILNADEPLLFSKKGTLPIKSMWISVQNPQADLQAFHIREKEDSLQFDIRYQDTVVSDIVLPTIGIHNVSNALAAYAVGLFYHMPEEAVRRGLLHFQNTGMRQTITTIAGITFIEDCYNAGLESMKASLAVLAKVARDHGGRSIAVLGDMRELGAHSIALHEEVGEEVEKEKISYLFTFGEEAGKIASGALKAGFSAHTITINPDLEAIRTTGDALLALLRPQDTVLLKASRAVRLERILDYVKETLERNEQSL